MEKSEKKILDLVVQKCLDANYQPDVWFSSNIFMIFGLPTQRLKGNPAYWIKEVPWCRVTITRDERYEIPYGCFARMNQIFIDTEVRTKNTNVIDVGRSFNEYVKKVGYEEGYANKALFRQLINYVTSVIKFEPKNPLPGQIIGIHSLIARAWDVYFDVKNPGQLMLSKGQIILEPTYAGWIHKHSAPLDMNMVRCFKRNPLALDFYKFLAYRNNELEETLALPDQLLFKQLTEEENDRKVRMKLKRILRSIQQFWPVRAKFEDGYFELRPSPPAVQKKLPSTAPIKIEEKFKDEP